MKVYENTYIQTNILSTYFSLFLFSSIHLFLSVRVSVCLSFCVTERGGRMQSSFVWLLLLDFEEGELKVRSRKERRISEEKNQDKEQTNRRSDGQKLTHKSKEIGKDRQGENFCFCLRIHIFCSAV